MSSQLYQLHDDMLITVSNMEESSISNSEVIIEPGKPPENVKISDKSDHDTTPILNSLFENRAISDDCAYVKVGPTFYDSHHFKINHKNNVLEALAKRTALKHELDNSSEEYKKFRDCYDYIISNVFTDKNISDVFIEMTNQDSSFLMSAKPKKMSDAEYFQRLCENFDKPLQGDVIFESFLKLESIHKLKAPRIIINEGPNAVVGQLLTALIYEHILFAWLPANNIKLLTRDQYSKQLSIRHSQKREIYDGKTFTKYANNIQYLLEIDQTSFDMSESSKTTDNKAPLSAITRREGLLVGEAMLFDKIANRLYDVLEVSNSNRAVTWRRTKDTRLTFHTKSGTINAKLDRRIRHSGDRMTSSGNFLIEFISTFVALFDDPLAVMNRIPRFNMSSYHKFWNATGTRTQIRDYNGFYGKVQGVPSLISPIVEGDDGMVGIECEDALNEDTIISRYNRLGLDAKVNLVVNGAVNFCGINYLAENGRTINDIYCPDIIRAISKIGIARKTLTKQDIYSANLVRAAEFAGKQDWLARIYKEIANKHESSEISLSKEDSYKYFRTTKDSITNLFNKFYCTSEGLSLTNQAKLMIMSIKDGIKNKYHNYDRLDEVVDFMISHSSIDWDNLRPKILLPPIIREELTPNPYTTTAICYNTQISNVSYHKASAICYDRHYLVIKRCCDLWETVLDFRPKQIPLVNDAECFTCGAMTIYSRYSKRDLGLKVNKDKQRFICATCGRSDKTYKHVWRCG